MICISIHPSSLFEPIANLIINPANEKSNYFLKHNPTIKNPYFARLQDKIQEKDKFGGILF